MPKTRLNLLLCKLLLAARIVDAHSTVADHGTSAYGTTMQPTRYTNSTEVANVASVVPVDVASTVARVAAQAVAAAQGVGCCCCC